MDQDRPFPAFEFDNKILAQGAEISRRLDMLRQQQFPPDARKQLRSFSMQEVARFLGVSPNNLKRLSLEDKGPTPEVKSGGRRYYTAEQILELRQYLDKTGKRVTKNYVPRRREGEKLQVIGVVNFKGGSGKTTTAVHLAQQLALSGHRVLALDLDPQASLSALFGFQPELDNNRSVYDALRYDDDRCSIAELISPTNFPDLDIVPANLELSEYEFETPLAAQSSREGKLFFTRLTRALEEVDEKYDVVVLDCPPQLGYLTLTAVTAATSILITVHPEMLDLMSMSQFLLTLGNFTKSLMKAGAQVEMDWLRYLITRYEPTDIPQSQMLGFMQSMFAEEILTNQMLKSTAISDAGLTKQSLFEVERANFNRETYDRALESMWSVNSEVQELIHRAWGRK
ncbi:plasmid partitioning protein RepA [Litoreibacter roseus]|uniref:Plasmid partitioning protein RepA n=1 Tax=Litoreibacter roseus TaxID=2601869 RepID=A0A6N6JLI0_9RHOB|nr:plasmid partitioning protein RepA [Litoreibacter roseus]GFE66974.1 plasmid partitioning protein RepA [Litoreibacter roseus]